MADESLNFKIEVNNGELITTKNMMQDIAKQIAVSFSDLGKSINDNFKKGAISTADAQKAANQKILQDTNSYYNQVKFADTAYYEWKKQLIKSEVATQNITNEQKLNLEKQLINQLENEYRNYQNVKNSSLDNTKAKASFAEFAQTAGSLTLVFSGVKNAISDTFSTIGDWVTKSNLYESALVGLSSTANAFGQSQYQAREAAKSLAADGLISVTAAASTLKMLMSTGFSLAESLQMAQAAKDIGAFGRVTQDFNQAFMDFGRGIKTGSVELFENIGLTQKMANVMKQANIPMSEGINLTESLAQRQAVLNSVLKQGNINQGDAAKYLSTTGGAMASIATQTDQLKKDFGDITKLIIGSFLPSIKELVGWMRNNLATTISIVAGAISATLLPVIAIAIVQLKALGTQLAFATGGLSLLTAGIAALITYGIVDHFTKTAKAAEDEKEKIDQLKDSVTALSAAELENMIAKAQAEDISIRRTLAYMRVKDAQLEAESKRAALTKLSNKAEAEAFAIHNAALKNTEKALAENSQAWEIYVNQRAKQMLDLKKDGLGGTEDQKSVKLQKEYKDQLLDMEISYTKYIQKLNQDAVLSDNELEKIREQKLKRRTDILRGVQSDEFRLNVERNKAHDSLISEIQKKEDKAAEDQIKLSERTTEKVISDWQKQNKFISGITDSITSNFGNSFAQMALYGKNFGTTFAESFKSMTASVLADLTAILLKAGLLKGIGALFGGAFGGLGFFDIVGNLLGFDFAQGGGGGLPNISVAAAGGVSQVQAGSGNFNAGMNELIKLTRTNNNLLQSKDFNPTFIQRQSDLDAAILTTKVNKSSRLTSKAVAGFVSK